MRTLIMGLLVFLTFYRHGTPQNFWYKLGKLTKTT